MTNNILVCDKCTNGCACIDNASIGISYAHYPMCPSCGSRYTGNCDDIWCKVDRMQRYTGFTCGSIYLVNYRYCRIVAVHSISPECAAIHAMIHSIDEDTI